MIAPYTKNGKTISTGCRKFQEYQPRFYSDYRIVQRIAFPRDGKNPRLFERIKQGMSVKGIDLDDIPEVILWGVRPCDAQGIGELKLDL